jgi:hypothetical protein
VFVPEESLLSADESSEADDSDESPSESLKLSEKAPKALADATRSESE